MKKHFPLVIGASLLTGLAGSILLRKKQSVHSENYRRFIGEWQYKKGRTGNPIAVTVTDKYQILFQDQLEPTTLVELTPSRLVLLDKLGYHIIFEEKNNQLTFYDETEDKTFSLTPINKKS